MRIMIQIHSSWIRIHKLFIISAKWMKWVVEILFSFDVCLCVCSELVNQTSLELKATNFKFVMHVPRDSPDMTP